MRHRERFVGDDDPVGGTRDGRIGPVDPGKDHAGHGRDAEERFQRMVDHSPDAICILQDGQFVYVNAVCVRWLAARSSRELLGHEISRFVHPTSIPWIIARTATLRRPGDVSLPSEAKLVRLDGTALHAEAVSVLTTWNGRTAYQLIFRDLTEHRAVRDTMRYQAALVDHVSDAIISTAQSGMVTTWNLAAESIYRRPVHRALALPISDAVGAPLNPGEIVAAGGVDHATHYAMDGTARAVRVSVTEIDNGYVLICSDETALRRAARHLNAVVDALEEGVVVVDQNGWLLTINPAARRIMGLGANETDAEHLEGLPGLRVYDVEGALLNDDEHPIRKALRTGLPTFRRVLGVDRADGERVWLLVTCRLLNPQDRDRSPVLVSFSDITAQRAITQRLAHQAAHDALTDLPNRAHIVETMSALQRGAGGLTTVLFIDLDDLKTVNDTRGHDVGDTVIQETANRLRVAVRKDDVVGRLGGDEFVALLIGELEDSALQRFVERIHRVLTEPIGIPGGTLNVSASIGVVQIARGDSRDAVALLREADAAMYAAKAKGRRASHFSRMTAGEA